MQKILDKRFICLKKNGFHLKYSKIIEKQTAYTFAYTGNKLKINFMIYLDINLYSIPLWITVMVLCVFIVLLVIALRTGREVSIWQIKIGQKPQFEKTNNLRTEKDTELINSLVKKIKGDSDLENSFKTLLLYIGHDEYLEPDLSIKQLVGMALFDVKKTTGSYNKYELTALGIEVRNEYYKI